MAFSYVPKRLKMAREDIALVHKYINESPKITKNEELRQLIVSLVSLDAIKVKVTAQVLSNKELDMVAGYIPHNYFNVDMKNLFTIFSARTTDRLCGILFNQWQDSYNNEKCNVFLREIIKWDEHLIVLAQKNHMNEEMFDSVLQDKDIAFRFGKELQKRKYVTARTLAERLTYFGIRDDSQLCRDCEFLFYTYCDKVDYLNIPKLDLLDLVKRYNRRGTSTLKAFLQNFLGKLELKELIGFRQLAVFLQGIIGDNANAKDKFEKFFIGFDPVLLRKYINWINLYKVEEFFGNDERSQLWKQYRFESVRRFNYSNAVIMEFEKYYAVEFLGQAMGPIYIYEKGYFERNLAQRFKNNNNLEMRSILLHSSSWFYRKEHRGYWQGDVHRTLINNKITERLVL